MNNSQEIWKDIIGYENLYQVSNLGRIKRLDSFINNNRGKCLHIGKILKPQVRQVDKII